MVGEVVNEGSETISSLDLELGDVFQMKNDHNGLKYIYIGCYDFYSFEETENTIFTTYTQVCDSLVHVFYCEDRNEFASFKWTVADKLKDKVDEKRVKALIEQFKLYPVGVRVKEAEFHINHLHFNKMQVPSNLISAKINLFYKSSFKEISKEHKIYLVLEWSDNTQAPNYKEFKPHIIKLIEGKKFSFDYIPQEHWSKFNGLFKVEDIETYLQKVKNVAAKNPGLICSFSSSLKEKFLWEKSKELQALKLGSLYLINDRK